MLFWREAKYLCWQERRKGSEPLSEWYGSDITGEHLLKISKNSRKLNKSWSPDSFIWKQLCNMSLRKTSAKWEKKNLVSYGILKILHMARMKICYNWLLIKLTHIKDSFFSPAQTRSQVSSLTGLCTLHNPYKCLIGSKILIVRVLYYRMYHFDKIHCQRWETDLLPSPQTPPLPDVVQRLDSRTVSRIASDFRWSCLIPTFRRIHSELQLSPDSSKHTESG